MEPFVLQPGEKLLVNDVHAQWVMREMTNVEGQLKLTDKRLVFVKNASPIAGILKLFFKSLRAQVLFDWPIEKIKSVEQVKFANTERLVIDAGIERPKQFISFKADTFVFELKRRMPKS